MNDGGEIGESGKTEGDDNYISDMTP